jgi:uncharacterized protein (TIGR03083 family)
MAEAAPGTALEGLGAVWASLVAVGRALDPDEFELATECPGWTVQDQFSHVIGAELLRDGAAPPLAAGADPPHVRNALGALNERFVAARRDHPGPDVVEELAALAAARLAALGDLDAEASGAGAGTASLAPYVDYASARTADAFVHEQDVRRATGRDGGRGGLAERATLDRLEAALPFVLARRVAPPPGTTVRIDVVGTLARTVQLGVVVGADHRPHASGVPVIDGPPTAWLRLDQETFARRACGRVTAQDALRAPTTEWAGDRSLVAALVASMVVVA